MTDNGDAEQNVVAGQKRQNTESGGPASKKAHVSGDTDVQIKILIPSGAVGALIGKGGETMRNLKNDSGCRVQMSKNQEVYRGTHERICLVKGKVSSVMMVMQAILEKIQEKIDEKCPSDQYDLKGTERSKEMKLVMPNTSAGLVIGKGGSSIKEIRESTGAQIQVYPKAGSEEAKTSTERVITIGADQNNVLTDALLRVLEKVASDPLHAQPTENTGKSDVSQSSGISNGAYNMSDRMGSNQFSNLSSYSSGANPAWQSQTSLVSDNSFSMNKSSYGSAPAVKFNPMQGLGNNELLSFLDSLQSTLRSSGFNEAAVSEIMQAMQILAKYNIMGLGLGLGVAAMAQMRTQDVQPQMTMQPPSQPQRFDLTQGMMQSHNPSGHISSLLDPHPTESLGSGSVLIDVLNPKKNGDHPTPNFASSVIKEKVVEDSHVELEVPDTIVGAVLGPKAKTLLEIQHLSGCKVEVHKRGTENVTEGHRLISLTGANDKIREGRKMIEKVINNEQSRRTQQPPRGTK